MSFNLIDNPWIPCKFIDGTAALVSLQELFSNAGKIEDLDSDNPLVNGGLYRLFIAIIHRAINGPKDSAVWKYLWEHDNFPPNIQDLIFSYLEKWHDRFFIFHEQYPFYQVPDLNEEKATTIAIIAPQLASGANATLFNHCNDNSPLRVSMDKAIKWIIAIQNYVLGGLNTPYDSSRITKTNKSAPGGPLAQAALVVITGKTFYKTLLLNLHQYNTLKNIPYKFSGDDKPVWERNSYTLPDERLPNGLVDWLTYQPRAIKLIPMNGREYVINSILMVGERLPKTEHRKNFETMVAFQKSKGKDPFSAINFSTQKAVWRDINALFQIIENTYRPKTMDWISDLIFDIILKEDYFPLQLFGACSKKASFLQFRYEILPFKPKRLSDNKFMNNLNENLQYLERIKKSLWIAIRKYVINTIPDLTQKLKSSIKFKERDNKKIRKKIEGLNILSNFWNQAEINFHKFLLKNIEDPNSIDLSAWEEKNKQTGINILREYLNLNNFDAQALKARTIAIKTYYKRLKNV